MTSTSNHVHRRHLPATSVLPSTYPIITPSPPKHIGPHLHNNQVRRRRRRTQSLFSQLTTSTTIIGYGQWLSLVAVACTVVAIFTFLGMIHHTNHNVQLFEYSHGVSNNDTHPNNNLIHIVNTRFMQEQANLTALSAARLELFRTFCLPTMIHQSTKNFLWIIKTDPQLSLPIRQEMISLLEPYPNFYLVGSNVNFLIPTAIITDAAASSDQGPNHQIRNMNIGAWRDGEEGRHLLEEAIIYTGRRDLLERAFSQQSQAVVLETRLDADDGLHSRYLEYIQQSAVQTLYHAGAAVPTEKPKKWLYWCSRRHMEWHAADILSHQNNVSTSSSSHSASTYTNTTSTMTDVPTDGWFRIMEHSKLCATPGITIGFAVDVKATDVPLYEHDKIYKEISQHDGDCQKVDHSQAAQEEEEEEKEDLTMTGVAGSLNQPANASLKCLYWVDEDVFTFAAIRSRTITSAGMRNVAADADHDNTTMVLQQRLQLPPSFPLELTQKIWEYLELNFFIERRYAEETQRYLNQHVIDIALDNLRGQCTFGHSCKQAAKEELLQLIQLKQLQQQQRQ